MSGWFPSAAGSFHVADHLGLSYPKTSNFGVIDLETVNLSIEKGKIFALLGVEKTTLSASAVPSQMTSGQVLVVGYDIEIGYRAARR